VEKEALNTFALDVDNASYSNVRRFLDKSQLPPRGTVRIAQASTDQQFAAAAAVAELGLLRQSA